MPKEVTKIKAPKAVHTILTKTYDHYFAFKLFKYMKNGYHLDRFKIEDCKELNDFILDTMKKETKEIEILTSELEGKALTAGRLFINNLKENKKIGKDYISPMLESIDAGLKLYEDDENKLDALKELRETYDKLSKYLDENVSIYTETIDKEELDMEQFLNEQDYIATSHVNSVDIEMFSTIKQIPAMGYQKAVEFFNSLKQYISTNDVDYNKISKELTFTKEKPFKDYYSTPIGVPAGLKGGLKEISLFIQSEARNVDILSDEIDGLILKLSLYVSSKDERESAIGHVNDIKRIQTLADTLSTRTKKFISAGSKDNRTIGSLINASSEVNEIVNALKASSEFINIKNLTSIKDKITEVDKLVVALLGNEEKLNKEKIKEVAGMIDVVTEYTRNVAALVYLKNSSDMILNDIIKVL